MRRQDVVALCACKMYKYCVEVGCRRTSTYCVEVGCKVIVWRLGVEVMRGAGSKDILMGQGAHVQCVGREYFVEAGYRGNVWRLGVLCTMWKQGVEVLCGGRM
jgi:hypothetical protein